MITFECRVVDTVTDTIITYYTHCQAYKKIVDYKSHTSCMTADSAVSEIIICK